MTEAIAGAAAAIARAVKPSEKPVSPKPAIPPKPDCSSKFSPGKTAYARMKNLEQLRYLQHLFQDGILTKSEYIEQKKNILKALHSL